MIMNNTARTIGEASPLHGAFHEGQRGALDLAGDVEEVSELRIGADRRLREAIRLGPLLRMVSSSRSVTMGCCTWPMSGSSRT